MATATASKMDSLTEREKQILNHIWACLKSPPSIDYDKLADACDIPSATNAASQWGKIQDKVRTGLRASKPNMSGTIKHKRGFTMESMSDEDSKGGGFTGQQDSNSAEMLLPNTPMKKSKTSPSKLTKVGTHKANKAKAVIKKENDDGMPNDSAGTVAGAYDEVMPYLYHGSL